MKGTALDRVLCARPGGDVPARHVTVPCHRHVRGLLTMRGVVVLILLLGVVLGSCASSDGHPRDPRPGPDGCDIQSVSIKPGAEREPSLDRTIPAVTPGLSDTTIVWHCGPPPGTPPPVVAVNSTWLCPHGPRAPPRG